MNPMIQNQEAIKSAAQDVEQFMRRVAAERGLSYTSLRGNLATSWFLQPSFDADELEILEQALQFLKAGDSAGFRSAGLSFLEARHGAKIGDQVNLHGFSRARDVIIEDFYLELDETDLLSKSKAVFVGPCLRGRPSNTRHEQALHETAVVSLHPRNAK